MDLDFGVVVTHFPHLLQAAVFTIFLAIISQALGTTFGFLLALGRISEFAWLRSVVWVYVWIFRGTPVLLHLMFVYYAAPLFGITLDAFPAAIFALTVSSAAYNCEIIRSGLQAVHHGQIESAQAVGMTYPRVMWKVVLPQATKIILPPFMGNFISHTKATSLASVITVPELMLTAQMIYSSTYRVIEILAAAGVIYLMLTSCLNLLQLYLERVMVFEERGLSRRRRRALLLPVSAVPAAEAGE